MSFSEESDFQFTRETQFVPQDGDEEDLWAVIEILDESRDQYMVRWAGVDPQTNKPFGNSWVPKHDCTDELVFAWKKNQILRKERQKNRTSKGSKKSTELDRKSKSSRATSSHNSRSSVASSSRVKVENIPSSPVLNNNDFSVTETKRKRGSAKSSLPDNDNFVAPESGSNSRPRKKRKVDGVSGVLEREGSTFSTTRRLQSVSPTSEQEEEELEELEIKEKLTQEEPDEVTRPAKPKQPRRAESDTAKVKRAGGKTKRSTVTPGRNSSKSKKPHDAHKGKMKMVVELPSRESLTKGSNLTEEMGKSTSYLSKKQKTQNANSRLYQQDDDHFYVEEQEEQEEREHSSEDPGNVRVNQYESPSKYNQKSRQTLRGEYEVDLEREEEQDGEQEPDKQAIFGPVLSQAAIMRLGRFDAEVIANGNSDHENELSSIDVTRDHDDIDFSVDISHCDCAALVKEPQEKTHVHDSNQSDIVLETEPESTHPTTESQNSGTGPLSSPVRPIKERMRPNMSRSNSRNSVFEKNTALTSGDRKDGKAKRTTTRAAANLKVRPIGQLPVIPSQRYSSQQLPSTIETDNQEEQAPMSPIEQFDSTASTNGHTQGSIVQATEEDLSLKTYEDEWEREVVKPGQELAKLERLKSKGSAMLIAKAGTGATSDSEAGPTALEPGDVVGGGISHDILDVREEIMSVEAMEEAYVNLNGEDAVQEGRKEDNVEDSTQVEESTSEVVHRINEGPQSNLDLREEEEESTQDILNELRIAERPTSMSLLPPTNNIEASTSTISTNPSIPRQNSLQVIVTDQSRKASSGLATNGNGRSKSWNDVKNGRRNPSVASDNESNLRSQLAQEMAKNENLLREISVLTDSLLKAHAEKDKRAAELQSQMNKAQEAYNSGIQQLEKERNSLDSTIKQITRSKLDAEKDRDFFKEQYSQASGFIFSVRDENAELEKRAKIAEEQAKTGVAAARELFQQRIKDLEADVIMWRRVGNFMIEKDSRTNDDIRRRAAEEPELRNRCRMLEETLEASSEQIADLEILCAEQTVEIDNLKAEVESLKRQHQQEQQRMMITGIQNPEAKVESPPPVTSDDLVYRCQWKTENGGEPCDTYFFRLEDLESHMYQTGHVIVTVEPT